jgi:hypothetical protein
MPALDQAGSLRRPGQFCRNRGSRPAPKSWYRTQRGVIAMGAI